VTAKQKRAQINADWPWVDDDEYDELARLEEQELEAGISEIENQRDGICENF
jgi:hypothetical protein